MRDTQNCPVHMHNNEFGYSRSPSVKRDLKELSLSGQLSHVPYYIMDWCAHAASSWYCHQKCMYGIMIHLSALTEPYFSVTNGGINVKNGQNTTNNINRGLCHR